MKHIGIVLLIVTLNILGPHPAVAHHNARAFYDFDSRIERKNVRAISWTVTNPHSLLVFIVTDDRGNEEEWTATARSASQLRRAGVTPDLIAPGDIISVAGPPHFVEKNRLQVFTIVLANGDVAEFGPGFGNGDAVSPAGSAGQEIQQ